MSGELQPATDKSPEAFRTISEVAQQIDVPQHVLRFWETRFAQIRPLKRGGGRRFYRPDDVELLKSIRHLLYGEGYTIRGVQRLLKEQGPKAVAEIGRSEGARVGRTDDGLSASESAAIDSESAPEGPMARHADDAAALPFAFDDLPSRAASLLHTEHIAQLESILAELAECQRLLTAALSL